MDNNIAKDVKDAMVNALIKMGKRDEAYLLMGKDAPYKDGLASVETEYWLDKFHGKCKAVLDIKNTIRLLSNVSDSVVICGPTGTGKEILANALHSKRKGKFVAVNCAGLPAYLVESELFGHKKGAFTGAQTDKIGLCEEASGGTLFLDEIGELPMMIQAKLLRCLQEKVVRPVGANEEKPVNFRCVSATHHNLAGCVEKGSFREDLYARLSTFEVMVPSLVDREIEEVVFLTKKLYGSDVLTGTLPVEVLNEISRKFADGLKQNYRDLQRIVRRHQVLVEKLTESLN